MQIQAGPALGSIFKLPCCYLKSGQKGTLLCCNQDGLTLVCHTLSWLVHWKQKVLPYRPYFVWWMVLAKGEGVTLMEMCCPSGLWLQSGIGKRDEVIDMFFWLQWKEENQPKWGTSCWSLQWDNSVPLAFFLNLSEDILSLQSKELAMYGQLLNSGLQKCAGVWNLHSKEPCCWEEALKKMRTGQESVWDWPRHFFSHDSCFRDS